MTPTSLLAPYDAFIDQDFGIINSVVEIRSGPGSPNFFRFAARAANTIALRGVANFTTGSGAAMRRESAVAKAVGEAVERYCSALFAREELPLRSFDEAEGPCVHPSRFALFADHQYASARFPYRPFTTSTRVRWVAATNIATGKEAWVPAAMVYLPYEFGPEEEVITQPISTGLACHATKEGASVSALCEVIERDAFTIWWQARCIRPQIAKSSLSLLNQEIVRRFETAQRRVSLFDIGTDVRIATIAAVQQSSSPDLPPCAFAAASHPSAEVAVRKCLEELAHTAAYMERIRYSVPFQEVQDGNENIVNELSHLSFWCDPRNTPGIEFVFRSDETIPFKELPSNDSRDVHILLKNVIDSVTHAGLEPLVSDLTTADVAECGFSVVRAVIPGCHPLFMGYAARALSGTRLREVPLRIGCSHERITVLDNPYPHPFP
jgi:ribosomal protein S12 methylthiotransferase accessory factor